MKTFHIRRSENSRTGKKIYYYQPPDSDCDGSFIEDESRATLFSTFERAQRIARDYSECLVVEKVKDEGLVSPISVPNIELRDFFAGCFLVSIFMFKYDSSSEVLRNETAQAAMRESYEITDIVLEARKIKK